MNIILTVIAYFICGRILNRIIAKERAGFSEDDVYESESRKVADEMISYVDKNEITASEKICFSLCNLFWPVYQPILIYQFYVNRKQLSEILKMY